MTIDMVHIRELAVWGFDRYEYRPELIANRPPPAKSFQSSPNEPVDAVLTAETKQMREMFAPHVKRADLLLEMSGLVWSFGMVDLRYLIAFQRRLAFNPLVMQPTVPATDDWPALFEFFFGQSQPPKHEAVYDRLTETITLRSENPNLQLRVTNDPVHPLSVHAGSPFFEVARFHGRWFLRDGYHRAYALLKANVFVVPAVIVEAATIEELGADKPWFFPEEVLFSDSPPRVVDFLNEDFVLEYDRPPLVKTVRITIEETLEPANYPGEQI